jgi:hypothetical protein
MPLNSSDAVQSPVKETINMSTATPTSSHNQDNQSLATDHNVYLNGADSEDLSHVMDKIFPGASEI